MAWRRPTIIWTNDGKFTDAYMRHSASMIYADERVTAKSGEVIMILSLWNLTECCRYAYQISE